MGAKARPQGPRRITKRIVDALPPGGMVWDAEVTGFGVRRQRGAGRVYVLKARIGGRQRWFTIGRHGSPWTTETARLRAKAILGQIADRKDPAAARDADKAIPNVASLAARFLAEHVEAKRKPRTAIEYRALFNRFILPALGHIQVQDVTRADVARLHHAMRQTPRQANFTLSVMSKLFNWSEFHGYRPEGSNPCRHVERYPERGRERFLSADELGRLGHALTEAERAGEHPSAIAALRLLALTGARKSEILTLRWADVDLDHACLRLPDSKTGAKVIPLGAPAVQVLASLPRLEGNEHVAFGDRPGAPFVGLQKVWERVRARAGLEGLRIHDLRHAFASVGAAAGDSLLVIGALLGHRNQATTGKYAHLGTDPVRAAADRISGHVAAMMNGAAGDVVSLAKRGRSRRGSAR